MKNYLADPPSVMAMATKTGSGSCSGLDLTSFLMILFTGQVIRIQ
jgi:hypothetical protein